MNIVSRVFSKTLNSIWGDLFTRLAPDEDFVPTLSLPKDQKGPLEAKLNTRYLDDIIDADPRSFLSAGNMHTAALTLFLALHLSVKKDLPWLIIDDPVQSMGDVHISQFAALLRTISKQQNRQIIIAVHEKPLFYYLKLELSPAFDGDSLRTIELKSGHNEKTIMTPEKFSWKDDEISAA